MDWTVSFDETRNACTILVGRTCG